MSAEPVDVIDLLAGVRSGAWLDAQQFTPLTYAVAGIVPEGSTLLVGAPKIGKSYLTLSCALAVASGGHALGCLPVDKRPVLYLALEDGDRRMQERCRSLLGADPIPAGFEYVTTVAHGLVVPTISAWLDQHTGRPPLVILDTLGKVMPPAVPGESAYLRDYRVGSALKAITAMHPGSSLVTVHHDRKAGSEDFVDAVSGTHGLAGAADTVVVLHRPRHEQRGTVNVTGRDVREAEYAVDCTAGAWQLVGGSLAGAAQAAASARATSGLGDRSAAVVAFVGEHPDGVGPKQVAEAVGLDATTASVYLGRAVEAGRLVKPKRGTYTPVSSVRYVGGERAEPNAPNALTEVSGRRCVVCGFPLDAAIEDDRHPTCDGAA